MLSARLAPTSKSLCNDSRAFVPLERAVVVARDSRLDGHMQDVGLHVPVKEPTSSGSPSAVGRYKRLGAYVAKTVFFTPFPPHPLPPTTRPD
jgi:hypothetical protein